MTGRSAPKNTIRASIAFGELEHWDTCALPKRIEGIKRAITAGEVAEFLAVSAITVYKMAKAGRLPSFRVGTAVRFDPCAVAEWLRRAMP